MANIERLPKKAAAGTQLVGYISVPYSKLTSKFGAPSEGDLHKTDAEWVLGIDGIVVTIYNYKDGKNYLGAKGKSLSVITRWHVGGKDKQGLVAIADALGVKPIANWETLKQSK